MTGNQAVAQGAQRAGCALLAICPTPPSRPLLDAFRRVGGRAVETTDAPDAIRHALAAAARGEKVLAATAGPALSACGEQVGAAQTAEVPLVIVHCQYVVPTGRGAVTSGPAVGLSLRGNAMATGDGDVILARHLTSGSLPMPVLAATDAASAYRLTFAAFQIAERLRTPVVLLTSKDIALGERPVDLEAVDLPVVRDERSAPPGDPANLEAKLTGLRDKITKHPNLLDIVAPDPDPDAETLLISYGLADQAARRDVTRVRAAGARVSHLTVHSLWPMPERAIRRAMTPYVRRVLVPELNLGLYADELRRAIKAVQIESILRYDGGQIDPERIARRITDWPCG